MRRRPSSLIISRSANTPDARVSAKDHLRSPPCRLSMCRIPTAFRCAAPRGLPIRRTAAHATGYWTWHGTAISFCANAPTTNNLPIHFISRRVKRASRRARRMRRVCYSPIDGGFRVRNRRWRRRGRNFRDQLSWRAKGCSWKSGSPFRDNRRFGLEWMCYSGWPRP